MSDGSDPDNLHELCRQASAETDSNKLLELVRKINQALDRKNTGHEQSLETPNVEKSA